MYSEYLEYKKNLFIFAPAFKDERKNSGVWKERKKIFERITYRFFLERQSSIQDKVRGGHT